MQTNLDGEGDFEGKLHPNLFGVKQDNFKGHVLQNNMGTTEGEMDSNSTYGKMRLEIYIYCQAETMAPEHQCFEGGTPDQQGVQEDQVAVHGTGVVELPMFNGFRSTPASYIDFHCIDSLQLFTALPGKKTSYVIAAVDYAMPH